MPLLLSLALAGSPTDAYDEGVARGSLAARTAPVSSPFLLSAGVGCAATGLTCVSIWGIGGGWVDGYEATYATRRRRAIIGGGVAGGAALVTLSVAAGIVLLAVIPPPNTVGVRLP